jgi:hypothetical protein
MKEQKKARWEQLTCTHPMHSSHALITCTHHMHSHMHSSHALSHALSHAPSCAYPPLYSYAPTCYLLPSCSRVSTCIRGLGWPTSCAQWQQRTSRSGTVKAWTTSALTSCAASVLSTTTKSPAPTLPLSALAVMVAVVAAVVVAVDPLRRRSVGEEEARFSRGKSAPSGYTRLCSPPTACAICTCTTGILCAVPL